MSATEKVDAVLQELARRIGGEVAHVNYGQSADYVHGFNCGYDDAIVKDEPVPYAHHAVPKDEPWLSAYLRGYDEGWECALAPDDEGEIDAEAEGEKAP